MQVSVRTLSEMKTTVKLSNGIEMPLVGFGTWQLRDAECRNSVKVALTAGYKMIDTAEMYRNEQDIAQVLKDFKREDVFITSKVAPQSTTNEETTYQACLNSLKNLNTPYLDLYLIHWPGAANEDRKSPKHRPGRLNSWKALERLYREGKVKSIGVSNYVPRHIEELMADGATIYPHVNQVELHIQYPQWELLEWNKKTGKNMIIQSYSTFGGTGAHLLQHNVVKRVAERVKQNPGSVLLRWAIQHGCVVLPRSKTERNIIENLKALTFTLSPEDMKELDDISKTTIQKNSWDPADLL